MIAFLKFDRTAIANRMMEGIRVYSFLFLLTYELEINAKIRVSFRLTECDEPKKDSDFSG